MTSSPLAQRSLLRTIIRPFVAGLLALFPLVLTVVVVVWLGDFVHGFLGPRSYLGKLLGSIGLTFATDEFVAYLIGLAATLLLIYFLGLLVETGMKQRWNALIDGIMRRVPLVSTIYDAAKQLMSMFGRREDSELKAMSPVLCQFGGEGGVMALALMPSPKRIPINGEDYVAVLIPTAPVPFGGGLLYVPVTWIKSVNCSVDGFLNVYMSMGVTSSDYLKA
jgi:uncharacterized membrane protein